jgi:hypothetical protein
VGPRTSLDDMEERKSVPLPGLEFQLISRLARSQSLYRLCYPSSPTEKESNKKGSTWRGTQYALQRSENMKVRNLLEDLSIGGHIILNGSYR